MQRYLFLLSVFCTLNTRIHFDQIFETSPLPEIAMMLLFDVMVFSMLVFLPVSDLLSITEIR